MSRQFKVTINRSAIRTKVITVEAESEGEAEDKAYDAAVNLDFSDNQEQDSTYEVMSIKEAGSQ